MNIPRFNFDAHRGPKSTPMKMNARRLLFAAVLIFGFSGALAACSPVRSTTLQGSEHSDCPSQVHFINHLVTCEKEKRGNWVACQVSGSVVNEGTERASNVMVRVEFGHELLGVRSYTLNLLGGIDPGEKVEFTNDLSYYEALTQYDISLSCDGAVNAKPTTAPTPKVSFTRLGPEDDVFTLVIDPVTPSTLYAGTQFQGVFRSTDGGLNWTPINSGMVNVKIGAIAVDPPNPSILYAGTYGSTGDDGAAYKSIDGGESWTEISNGMLGAYVFSLVIDPQNTATIYAGTSDGIFKSINGGEWWASLETGDKDPYIPQVILDSLTPANLYAVSSGNEQGILKSTNAGEDWILIKPEFFYLLHSLVIDPTTPTTLYAGTGWGVYKSTDSGDTWFKANTGLGDYATITALIVDPAKPATLYAAVQNKDIFKTTDGAESWSALGSNLGERFVYTLVVDPLNPAVLYAGTDRGVFVLGK